MELVVKGGEQVSGDGEDLMTTVIRNVWFADGIYYGVDTVFDRKQLYQKRWEYEGSVVGIGKAKYDWSHGKKMSMLPNVRNTGKEGKLYGGDSKRG
ncbi:unnamed protein product [Ilex paraguariensis]|uniref:Uncharacterized protein n=1 Tax=Ilex paraguariensis TaxID=185542 RepID=A0ABC8T5L9_9AQUA